MSEPERPDPLAPPEGYGSQSAARRGGNPVEDENKRLAASQCSVCTSHDGTGRCPGIPVLIIAIGCQRGEHAGWLGYCEKDAARVQPGTSWCSACGGKISIMAAEWVGPGQEPVFVEALRHQAAAVQYALDQAGLGKGQDHGQAGQRRDHRAG